MPEKQLVEFALEDGTTFLVEVDKQPTQPGAPKPVSRGNGVSVTAASKKWLLRPFYGELILKCQFNKLRNLKLLKLRNPYPSLLINLSLLLIPSTVPLVVLSSK